MLSRVNELRFSVLDLSELKERRLGAVSVNTKTTVTMIEEVRRRSWEEGGWKEEMKVNRKHKHKHIKCMQLPGT